MIIERTGPAMRFRVTHDDGKEFAVCFNRADAQLVAASFKMLQALQKLATTEGQVLSGQALDQAFAAITAATII